MHQKFKPLSKFNLKHTIERGYALPVDITLYVLLSVNNIDNYFDCPRWCTIHRKMKKFHLIVLCLVVVYVKDSIGEVELELDSENSHSIIADWSVEGGNGLTGFIVRYKPVADDDMEGDNESVLFEEANDVSNNTVTYVYTYI